jgi:hypothetical protein
LTWYNLLTDWGSLIGGFFALVAGALAYFSGMLQADATTRAAKAAERENQRRLAGEGLVANRLMYGVMSRIVDDISKLNDLLSDQQYSGTNAVAVPLNWFNLISKPSLGILWNSLGTCGIEFVKEYLKLDAALDRFADGARGSVYMREGWTQGVAMTC